MKQMLILHSLTIPGMVGNYFTENKLVIIGCFKVVRPVQALQALSPFLGSVVILGMVCYFSENWIGMILYLLTSNLEMRIIGDIPRQMN